MQQGIGAVPDKDAQMMLKALKLSARENEIVIEADIPDNAVAEMLKSATAPKAPKPAVTAPAKPVRRPVRKKRTH
jgi:hypothetical protein